MAKVKRESLHKHPTRSGSLSVPFGTSSLADPARLQFTFHQQCHNGTLLAWWANAKAWQMNAILAPARQNHDDGSAPALRHRGQL